MEMVPETKYYAYHCIINDILEQLKDVEIFHVRTSRRNKIACIFVRPCGPDAHFTLLFSHGNAVDLGQMCRLFNSNI
jgi:hypothetical protein